MHAGGGGAGSKQEGEREIGGQDEQSTNIGSKANGRDKTEDGGQNIVAGSLSLTSCIFITVGTPVTPHIRLASFAAPAGNFHSSRCPTQ